MAIELSPGGAIQQPLAADPAIAWLSRCFLALRLDAIRAGRLKRGVRRQL